MGGTSRQSYAATFPPDQFHCLLDELPLHLVPRQFFQSRKLQEICSRPLFINPHCTMLPSGEFPSELLEQRELAAIFVSHGTIAWVRNPETGSMLPFWLGPRLASVVQALSPDVPAQQLLNKEDLAVLAAAGVLISKDQNHGDSEQSHEHIVRSSAFFQHRGYVPAADLIHPFHIAALRRYYRCLIRQGKIRLGDQQSSRRYIAYNEPVTRFFHRQIAATVQALVGQPIKPSYVYMASYQSGAVLKKHTDREQCEFSVTLCVDFSPEPVCETSWPIRLQTQQGTTAVYQRLGDGLVYRGTRVPHYRYALGEGKTSTSIFFHYVAADFEGPLD
jgi:hypothetical protein